MTPAFKLHLPFIDTMNNVKFTIILYMCPCVFDWDTGDQYAECCIGLAQTSLKKIPQKWQTESTSLVDLVSEQSFTLFNLLNI